MEVKFMKELSAIQAELKAPKSKTNKHGNYQYRNAEGIFEAVKPLLTTHKCLLHIEDNIIHHETNRLVLNQSTNEWYSLPETQTYIESTATLVNESGETVSSKGLARVADTLAGMSYGQISGATSSYARKYALNALFLIDESKDLDDESITKAESEAQEQAKTTKQPKQATNAPQEGTATDFINACADLDKCKTEEDLKVVWRKWGHVPKFNVEFSKFRTNNKI